MVEVQGATGGQLVPVAQVGTVEEPEVAATMVRRRNQRGMVTAEWAVGMIAAVAIAGVLLAVVTNGGVKTAILNFILLVIRAFAISRSFPRAAPEWPRTR